MRLILCLFALFMMPLPTADACTMECDWPGPAAAAKRAKVAFVGTITKTTASKRCAPRHPTWCTTSYSYEVTVEGMWKGTVDKTVVVSAGSGAGDCSNGPLASKSVDGQRWLFFSENDALSIRLCSGTTRATERAIAAVTKAVGAPST